MKISIILLSAVLVAACARAPAQTLLGADPADPDAPVAPTRYSSALGTYVSQRPVEPAPWREQNERVAPRQQQ